MQFVSGPRVTRRFGAFLKFTTFLLGLGYEFRDFERVKLHRQKNRRLQKILLSEPLVPLSQLIFIIKIRDRDNLLLAPTVFDLVEL